MRMAHSCHCYSFCHHLLIIHCYPLHGHWGQIQLIIAAKAGHQLNWILITKSHHVAQLPIWALLAEGWSADCQIKQGEGRRAKKQASRGAPYCEGPSWRFIGERCPSRRRFAPPRSPIYQCTQKGFRQRLWGLRGCILHLLLVLKRVCWIIVLVRAPCTHVLAQGYFRLALLFNCCKWLYSIRYISS